MDFTATNHCDTYPFVQDTSHEGLSVLITGASRGIGRVTALSLARSGASPIIITARSSLDAVEADILLAAQEANRPPPVVLKLAFDVSHEAGVAEAATLVGQKLGRLDILINNAGYAPPFVVMGESNPADWWMTWEVNLKSVYLMTRAFLPLLLESSHKTIVNISSMGALDTATPRATAYQTSKFALLRLTELTTTEYGKQGVIAYAVHPGSTVTDIVAKLPEEYYSFLTDTIELSGDSIAWLTQKRREWLSGRYVSANWDMEELEARKDEIVQGDKLKMKLVV